MNLPPFWYQFSGSRLWVALHFASSGETTPRYVCLLGAGPGLSPRVRKNLTQVDLLGYADHPLQRGDGSPLRPAGKALAPARQHKYDDVHDEHGDESQQNHD